MRGILAHGRAIGARRAAEVIEALVDTAQAELPPGLTVERQADGIAIGGRGLARRLALDGRLRGLAMLLKAARR